MDHILHRQIMIGGAGILGGDAHAIVMVTSQRAIGIAIQGETLQSHVICSDDDPLVSAGQRVALVSIRHFGANDRQSCPGTNQSSVIY